MAPVVTDRIHGARRFATLAFADELVSDPGLLGAYASAFGPDDDATLVVYATDDGGGRVEQELGRALVEAGVDPARCPDLLAVYAPSSPLADLKLAAVVDAVFTHRQLAAPFDRLEHFDADATDGLRARAFGEHAPLAA